MGNLYGKKKRKLYKNKKPKLYNNTSKLKLKLIKSINAHMDWINLVSKFPSGNIISVSNDKSIKIYDINYNIIQDITKAHNRSINYIDIKDENNFVTCSNDKSIKTWIKNKNKFILNQNLENAHNDDIYKVIYYSNEKLISYSYDGIIKIWEENINNYQLITSLKHSNFIYSILLINDKNLLISSDSSGTKLWNLNNVELIKYFEEAKCDEFNVLNRIDEEKIIISGNETFIIISLLEKKIIKEIKTHYSYYGINSIKEKGILLGGRYNDILILRNDNYKCVQIIKNAHDDYIKGFINLKNGFIASYSDDGKIKIWSFGY